MENIILWMNLSNHNLFTMKLSKITKPTTHYCSQNENNLVCVLENFQWDKKKSTLIKWNWKLRCQSVVNDHQDYNITIWSQFKEILKGESFIECISEIDAIVLSSLLQWVS